MSKLTKPVFVKVSSLADARNGYNVYVKVVSVEETKSNDGQSTFARAVVADETGSANAFFKGETIKLIKQGAIIAIRNGSIRLIKNHISLEIDLFGRVTPETVEIKENTKENIS
jgi:ssDNA-binding replication factor A large subunit